MADAFATPDDLAKLPGLSGIDPASAQVMLECATSVIQAALNGQTILQVADDTFELLGTTDSWLDLPQRPVTAVTAVTVDGGDPLVEGTDYVRYGSRLWRSCGWARCASEPSKVSGTYTHGYDPIERGFQPARSTALMLAASVASGPVGVTSERIDDYQVMYEQMAARLDASPFLLKALQRQYGRRAGLVRLG